MRTRSEIEGDRIAISTVNVADDEQRFTVALHERHLTLEVLLDIRDLLHPQPATLTEDDVRRIVMETIKQVAHEAAYGT